MLIERRGTCSAKHAALAREQQLPVRLMLGIFEMTGENTPAVADVLRAHELEAIPDARGYLEVDGTRVDLTASHVAMDRLDMMHEEPIAPRQVHAYKSARHREFLGTWLARHHEVGRHTDLDVDALWKVREACIVALSRTAVETDDRHAV